MVLNGRSASKTIWMNLNGSTACYQHIFEKVEIFNGFKWSISRGLTVENVCQKLHKIAALKTKIAAIQNILKVTSLTRVCLKWPALLVWANGFASRLLEAYQGMPRQWRQTYSNAPESDPGRPGESTRTHPMIAQFVVSVSQWQWHGSLEKFPQQNCILQNQFRGPGHRHHVLQRLLKHSVGHTVEALYFSCNKPQGKLTGYTLDKVWMNKDKFTRAGFELATSGLTCQRSTKLSYPARYWRSPYFVNIFVRGRQSEVMKPYTALSPGITPELRYNLGRGSKGCTIKGYNFFFCKYHVIKRKGNWLGTF